VLNIVLSNTGDDSFSNTTSQLSALGHNLANRKYMILMDANVLCGIGGMYLDDSAGANNNNNFGPSYGRTDNGCWGAHTLAHELNHNLGGVQDSAPNSTQAGHCVDEKDVMCYSDSPNFPPMQNVCTDSLYENRLDCNHNDYYHPNPPAGSYLATHWNTANNQFLINTSLPPPTPTPSPTATATPFPGCAVYNSTDVPKTIADLVTVTSNLSVAGTGTLTDVNVRNLRIAHTYDSDLNVYLVSPAGTQVELFTAVGGNGNDFTNTWLDDAASQAIANGTAPFTGLYKPEGLLSAFNGQNRNGTWQLRITDTAADDAGQLTAWSLELCVVAGTPTSTPTPTPTPTTSNATITIGVDAQPNHSQNFRFTGTLNSAFFLDDDAGATNGDATYNSSLTLSKAAGSYTAIATAYTNWFLTGIACTPANAATVNLTTRTVTINATAGASINCTFTQQRAATVRATKYNDLNNSGTRNSAEPYMSGWTMTLYNAQNNMLASGITDVNGRVDFTGRLPGTYKVCETLIGGWVNTQPNTLDPVLGRPCRTVTTQPGVTSTVPLGNRALAVTAQGAAVEQQATAAETAEGITTEIEADALEESPEAPASE
jgi:subtilisin-like proprotein convertase family protein